MPIKKPRKQEALVLKHNTWHFRKRVPKELINHYGKEELMFSLRTSDLDTAILMRDKKIAEMSALKVNSNNLRRAEFQAHLSEILQQSSTFRGKEFFDIPFSPQELRAMGEDSYADALEAALGNDSVKARYTLSLAEATSMWQERNKDHVSADTLGRSETSAKKYAAFLESEPSRLLVKDLTLSDTHDYVVNLEKRYAATTIKAELSRLAGIWDIAKVKGHSTGENPFIGVEIKSRKTREDSKKELFSAEEMKAILTLVKAQDINMRTLVKLAIYSGARISELANLQVEDYKVVDSIHTLKVKKGKTPAARRIIPISEELADTIIQLRMGKEQTDRILGYEPKDASRLFSKLKQRVTTNRARSFHSFRGHFITTALQVDIHETVCAELVGHAKGKTMSFNYYAKGHELKRLHNATQVIAESLRKEYSIDL